MLLSRFEKPSRYINREVNSLHKNSPLKIALAFPDIYDIGMSHLGLRILYKIINDIPYASAERVFAPWSDMEAELRAKGLPLLSLESNRPLRDFDIVGFSLQYELSYTTVLNMLSLGGIPLRSHERQKNDPFIIAGGPCTVNPAPMSPFIDAFLIGDGEEAVPELLAAAYTWKTGSDGRRETFLRMLSCTEGMYVPAIHGPSQRSADQRSAVIKRRFISSLDNSHYPLTPVVPYTSVVHDRITIEISRGCTMGCRFCQAGMVYRPLRERNSRDIIRIAEESLKNTGHEEISLVSLSAGDYGPLLPLTRELNRRLSRKTVSLSLPSLRVAAVNQEVLREIKSVRKTGFTMAPEAATERLRAVMNKDFSEEDYERALHALFTEGWENLKLYFMIGLPTETERDVEAIPEMALKAIKVAKQYTRRYVNLNIGISPFVPKSHTPFQWCGQEKIGNLRVKLDYLRKRLSKKGMNMKGHHVEMSLLEAVLARGNSSVSDLIEKAWSLGSRLDAWTESFDFLKWLEAAEATGTDLYACAEKEFRCDHLLPWHCIEVVSKDFLEREYQKAFSGDMTEDCRKQCNACGLPCATGSDAPEDKSVGRLPDAQIVKSPAVGLPHSSLSAHSPVLVRIQFSKTGMLKHLSHRELMTAFIRAVRRADIPVAYSQGFHPSARLSFSPPLSVGISGLRECFDMELTRGIAIEEIIESLNRTLPEDLRVHRGRFLTKKVPSLQSFISRYEYEIICPDAAVIEPFLREHSVLIRRQRNRGQDTVSVDIRQMVSDLVMTNKTTVVLTAEDRGETKVRLSELVSALFGADIEELGVTRLRMFGWEQGWRDPMESLGMRTGEQQEDYTMSCRSRSPFGEMILSGHRPGPGDRDSGRKASQTTATGPKEKDHAK